MAVAVGVLLLVLAHVGSEFGLGKRAAKATVVTAAPTFDALLLAVVAALLAADVRRTDGRRT